ncbi:MAG: hypothetical protein ABSC02_15705 [Acidobacteriota bacterium]
MDLIELLNKKGSEIVDKATDAIVGSHLRHYENASPAQTRERLKTLFDLTLDCLVRKSPMPMIKYAEKIAQQRFSSGFSLREVQTAFNLLEESIWDQILNEMKPVEYAKAVLLVDTPLRIGKESIARMYFSFVDKGKVPSLEILNDFIRTEIV